MRTRSHCRHISALLLLICLMGTLAVAAPSTVDVETGWIEDRLLVEHVYYNHRLGEKPPFEQEMPREVVRKFLHLDQKKESVLRDIYGLEVTPKMVQTEVQRIHATTRAPEILAEIASALNGDAVRFARTVARPILVERELRRRFDNDEKLHAAQRVAAENARQSLLANKPVEGMHEVTWELMPNPAAEKPAGSAPTTPTQASSKSNAYTNEATAQIAQVISPSSPASPGGEKKYFGDLDPELQKVLSVQLQMPGDVSAVIETSGYFLTFLTIARTEATLSAKSFSIPKRGYEEWLEQQFLKTP